jgi:hypothetical protein
MIRADWTPLWAADWSNCKRLGPRQVACLEALRERGELTRRELTAIGISRRTLDELVMVWAGHGGWPPLVDFTDGYPDGRQRYFLAAPGQQEALDAVLAVIAAHPEGISCELLRKEADGASGGKWRAAAEDHIINTHLARYESRGQVYWPAGPGDELSPMAQVIGRRMTVRWRKAAAA